MSLSPAVWGVGGACGAPGLTAQLRWCEGLVASLARLTHTLGCSGRLDELGQNFFKVPVRALVHHVRDRELRLARHAGVDLADVG
jgi:hypothetical protein